MRQLIGPRSPSCAPYLDNFPFRPLSSTDAQNTEVRSTSVRNSPTVSPTVRTSSPTVRTSSPTVRTSSPTVRTSSPTVRTSSPTVRTSSPTVRTSSPTHTRVSSQITMRPSVSFYLCFLLCVCLGVACVVGVCVWGSQWRGGFDWDALGHQFNWHPVLMVSGLVVLYGYGAVMYRVPLTWGGDKWPWKLAHAGVMLLALLLSIVGLCSVFQVHRAKSVPALYSLHSWVGICTVALFAAQWVVGLGGFLLPWSPVSLRVALKPVHMWLGASILTLSVAACISGINENLIFALKGTDNVTQPYSSLPPEAVFANSLGVLIVLFGLVVLRILSNRNWERPEPGSQDVVYRPLLQEENE